MNEHSEGRGEGRDRNGPQGTMLFQRGELPEAPPEPAGTEVEESDLPVLVGIAEPFKQQRLLMRPGRHSLGRQSDNDIVLQEPSVSSQHAWVINEDGECRVMNLLSTNGTWVNGERVHEATLREGDRVRFGGAEFVFHHRDHAGAGLPLAGRRPRWRAWLAGGAAVLVVAVLVRIGLEVLA
ncbi:FHA domain-containing protein [Thioalkalivibrio sp. ALE20]|uniref:FHA domain-containing protein n=1 Tax=Thioalkalivibrio sp. ALE20 TaxID=545275 RepID=UPI00036ABC7E|nr:FHA domain-containing protein [Thioalkalivibrio sp. ALE20]